MVGSLICGSCAETEGAREQRDTLSPLTNMREMDEPASNDENLRGETGARLGLGTSPTSGVGGVGLGLSLGRFGGSTGSVPGGAGGEEGAGGAGQVDCQGGVGATGSPFAQQADHSHEGRLPSFTSDTSSPGISSLHLADVSHSPSTSAELDHPSQPVAIPSTAHANSSNLASTLGPGTHPAPQSLPTPPVLPWTTSKPAQNPKAALHHGPSSSGDTSPVQGVSAPKGRRAGRTYDPIKARDKPYQPLLDVTSERVSNAGRGALYAGSVFKGTQTSGRSAYDVEIRFLVCPLTFLCWVCASRSLVRVSSGKGRDGRGSPGRGDFRPRPI